MWSLSITFLLLMTVNAADDISLYNKLGTVSGHVTIENHPELGSAPCRNCEFLLQNSGCSRAVIYVRTDGEGNYRVRVSHGKWRVIMREQREGATSSTDMLAPSQPRYVKVSSPTGEERFDVKVSLPDEPRR